MGFGADGAGLGGGQCTFRGRRGTPGMQPTDWVCWLECWLARRSQALLLNTASGLGFLALRARQLITYTPGGRSIADRGIAPQLPTPVGAFGSSLRSARLGHQEDAQVICFRALSGGSLIPPLVLAEGGPGPFYLSVLAALLSDSIRGRNWRPICSGSKRIPVRRWNSSTKAVGWAIGLNSHNVSFRSWEIMNGP